MAFDIVTKTANGETDKRLVVLENAVRRKSKIGTNWTYARVVMRLATSRNSAWTNPPAWWFGMMSGTSDPPGSATPQHFIGVKNKNDWTNSTNYIEMGTGITRTKYEGGLASNEDVASVTGVHVLNCFKTPSGRSIWALEIIKPPQSAYSPNWEIRMYASLNSSNCTPTEFQNVLSAPIDSLGSVLGNNMIASSGRPIAINEGTYGMLDTGVFSWMDDTESFELCDFDVVVVKQ